MIVCLIISLSHAYIHVVTYLSYYINVLLIRALYSFIVIFITANIQYSKKETITLPHRDADFLCLLRKLQSYVTPHPKDCYGQQSNEQRELTSRHTAG